MLASHDMESLSPVKEQSLETEASSISTTNWANWCAPPSAFFDETASIGDCPENLDDKTASMIPSTPRSNANTPITSTSTSTEEGEQEGSHHSPLEPERSRSLDVDEPIVTSLPKLVTSMNDGEGEEMNMMAFVSPKKSLANGESLKDQHGENEDGVVPPIFTKPPNRGIAGSIEAKISPESTLMAMEQEKYEVQEEEEDSLLYTLVSEQQLPVSLAHRGSETSLHVDVASSTQGPVDSEPQSEDSSQSIGASGEIGLACNLRNQSIFGDADKNEEHFVSVEKENMADNIGQRESPKDAIGDKNKHGASCPIQPPCEQDSLISFNQDILQEQHCNMPQQRSAIGGDNAGHNLQLSMEESLSMDSVAQLQAELEAERAKTQDALRKVSSLEYDMEKMRQTLNVYSVRLPTQISSLGKVISDYKAKIQRLEHENEILAQERVNLVKTSWALRNKLSVQDQHEATLSARISELEGEKHTLAYHQHIIGGVGDSSFLQSDFSNTPTCNEFPLEQLPTCFEDGTSTHMLTRQPFQDSIPIQERRHTPKVSPRSGPRTRREAAPSANQVVPTIVQNIEAWIRSFSQRESTPTHRTSRTTHGFSDRQHATELPGAKIVGDGKENVAVAKHEENAEDKSRSNQNDPTWPVSISEVGADLKNSIKKGTHWLKESITNDVKIQVDVSNGKTANATASPATVVERARVQTLRGSKLVSNTLQPDAASGAEKANVDEASERVTEFLPKQRSSITNFDSRMLPNMVEAGYGWDICASHKDTDEPSGQLFGCLPFFCPARTWKVPDPMLLPDVVLEGSEWDIGLNTRRTV